MYNKDLVNSLTVALLTAIGINVTLVGASELHEKVKSGNSDSRKVAGDKASNAKWKEETENKKESEEVKGPEDSNNNLQGVKKGEPEVDFKQPVESGKAVVTAEETVRRVIIENLNNFRVTNDDDRTSAYNRKQKLIRYVYNDLIHLGMSEDGRNLLAVGPKNIDELEKMIASYGLRFKYNRKIVNGLNEPYRAEITKRSYPELPKGKPRKKAKHPRGIYSRKPNKNFRLSGSVGKMVEKAYEEELA